MNKIEITGKTLNDAVDAACAKLGIGINDIDWEVLEEATKGIFGFGAKPYKILAWSKIEEEPKVEFKPKAAPKKEFKPKHTSKPKPQPKPQPKAEPKAEAVKAKPEPKVEAAPKLEPAPKAEQIEKASVVEAVDDVQNERANLTEEDKTAIINVAIKFLKEVLTAANMNIEFESQFIDNKQIIIDMKGEDMGAIIGKRGQTLDSLQYLTNLVVNRGEYPYMNVTLDTEGYRARRKETLEHLAFNLAKKAKHNRRNVNLEPMNPYERRIIHATLQNDRYVTTYSEGVEPYRYVVIALKNNYSRRNRY